MSDGEIKEFELSDGTRAKVPSQHIEKWMRRMEARGVGFKSAGAPVASELAPMATQPQATPAPQPAQPAPKQSGSITIPYGDWLKSAGQSTADFARGVGRGLTFDGMASMSAGLTPEVDDGTGIPRTYAAGSATADLTASNRRDDAEAQARSPYLTAAGAGLGMAPAAVASTAAAGPAGMVAAPVAFGAMTRGGRADTAEQFAENVADPAAVATDATIGMAVPAALQAGQASKNIGAAVDDALPRIGDKIMESRPVRAVADKARSFAEGAGEVADNLRFGSYGARGSDVRAVANARGVDHLGDIARESEAMGLDKGGLLSSSWKSALQNSDRVLTQTGKDIGAWLAKLSQPGSKGIADTELAQMFDDYANGLASGQYGKVDAVQPLLKTIRDQAESLRTSALGPTVSRTDTTGSVTRQYRQGKMDPLTLSPASAEPMTIAEANALKGEFNNQAFEGMRAMDSTRADANRAMGKITRDAIMSRAQEVDPVAADALTALYRKYDIASSVKDAAQQRVLQESGNLQPSMYAVIGGAGGGPLGAIAGQLSKIKGAATMADAARATQRGASRVSDALTPAQRGADLPAFGPSRAPFPEPRTAPQSSLANQSASPAAAAALTDGATGNVRSIGDRAFTPMRSAAQDQYRTTQEAADINRRAEDDPKFRAWMRAQANDNDTGR